MLNYFQILSTLFYGHILYCFNLKSSNPKLYYTAVCLFSKHSYRLPESSKKDLLIMPRMYFFVLRQIFSREPDFKTLNLKSPVAITDTNYSAMEKRLQYLNYFNVDGKLFIGTEGLLGTKNSLAKVLHFIFVSFGFLFVLPFSFSSKRVNYALLLREIPELVNLLSVLQKNKINHLYQFCIFEKDSNFISYILSKKKIKVSKITSEVPLTFSNKMIIADEINLGFSYQKEECEAFKESLFYSKLNVWLPELQIDYINLYQDKSFVTPAQSIGFYSSGYWLRKQLNHSQADIGSYDAEEQLLKYLKLFIEKHPAVQLTVFAHPYEKKTKEQFAKTLDYYTSVFGTELMPKITISDEKAASAHLFYKVNIGVSIFSAIIFERLSLGFKSILAPLDKKDFPLLQSPFRNICAYGEEELNRNLENNLLLSKKEFFEKNKISDYIPPYIHLDYELI